MNEDKEQIKDIQTVRTRQNSADSDSFVLERDIFRNIFDKDIQRIYLYKKSERFARAIQLVLPAFKNNAPLYERLEQAAVSIIDASITASAHARGTLSKELLAVSSILSLAKTAGILSPMNVEFLSQESHQLLQEVAGYEEPRVSLPDAPSVAMLARASVTHGSRKESLLAHAPVRVSKKAPASHQVKSINKGHIKDTGSGNERRDSILSVVRAKGSVYIKDISMVIRNVSEKTIQRELQALVIEGVLRKEGERRWTRYSLS